MATANARGAAERVSDPARRAASDNAPAAGTGGAPPASAGGSGDPPGVWPRLRAASALAIGQLGAITALAFYFGWVRTQSYLHYFGLDTSLVDFTTTDYVLRSVNAAYWPLMALGTAVVVALALHDHVAPWVRRMSTAEQRRCRRTIASAGLFLILLAAAGLRQKVHFPSSLPGIPLLITAGVGLIAYSWAFGPHAAGSRGLLRQMQLVAMIGLIAGAVFWAWGSYADTAGKRAAEGLAADLPSRAEVFVYSTDRLGLGGHGVEVTSIGGDDGHYHFRYSGMRLLLRSNSRYFLLPKQWTSGQDVVFILAENDSTRLEFMSPPHK